MGWSRWTLCNILTVNSVNYVLYTWEQLLLNTLLVFCTCPAGRRAPENRLYTSCIIIIMSVCVIFELS